MAKQERWVCPKAGIGGPEPESSSCLVLVGAIGVPLKNRECPVIRDEECVIGLEDVRVRRTPVTVGHLHRDGTVSGRAGEYVVPTVTPEVWNALKPGQYTRRVKEEVEVGLFSRILKRVTRSS